MRLFIQTILFTLLFLRPLFAHKEWVHQYLVKQAYWTLEIQHDASITLLKDQMGFISVGFGDDLNS